MAEPTTSRDRQRAYRDRMRQRGYRQITLWVPDVTSPEFKAEAHRQSLLIANSPYEEENQRFIEDLTDDLFDDGE